MIAKRLLLFSSCIIFLGILNKSLFANVAWVNPQTINIEHCQYKATGGSLDLAILTKGFFVVKRGKSDKLYFSRNGVLMLNSTGAIINNRGNLIQGINKETAKLSEIHIPSDTTYLDVTPDGDIIIGRAGRVSERLAQSIAISNFDNPYALYHITEDLLLPTVESGQGHISIENGFGAILQGYLESQPCF